MEILWFNPKKFYLNTDLRPPNQKVLIIVKNKLLYLLSYTLKNFKCQNVYIKIKKFR